MNVDQCIQIDGDRRVWLTEISRQTFEDHGVTDLESDNGLFVVLEHGRHMEILAKVASAAAGQAMLALFSAQK